MASRYGRVLRRAVHARHKPPHRRIPPLPQSREEGRRPGPRRRRLPLAHRIVDQHQPRQPPIPRHIGIGQRIQHPQRPPRQHHTPTPEMRQQIPHILPAPGRLIPLPRHLAPALPARVQRPPPATAATAPRSAARKSSPACTTPAQTPPPAPTPASRYRNRTPSLVLNHRSPTGCATAGAATAHRGEGDQGAAGGFDRGDARTREGSALPNPPAGGIRAPGPA